MKTLSLVAYLALTTVAFAQSQPSRPAAEPTIDPSATVTLTYGELAALIQKQVSAANPLASEAEAKLKAAFAPKPSPPPTK